MKLIPLSERQCSLIAHAIDAEITWLEDAMEDEPSMTAVEGWRNDIRELLELRKRFRGFDS